jgi:protein-S-isoprenylcysteine O-methyltransferase Ste14
MKKVMPTTFLLVGILVCLALHFIVPVLRVIPTPWTLSGIIPLLLGIWMNLSADRAFTRARTTVKPFEVSSALIQDGVFRLSRNPMYLGFTAILLGVAMLLGSISPFIVTLAFPPLIDAVFIRTEERMLEAKFGDEWRRYQSRVRKWI